MNILFDATTLSHYNDYNGHRAGVFFVSLNLLEELETLGAKITLYCDFSRYYYLKNIPEFAKYKIIYDKTLTTEILSKISYFMKHCHPKIQYTYRAFIRFYQAKSKINTKNLDKIEVYDAYFSPFAAPSKLIENSKLPKFRMIHDVIPLIEGKLNKNSTNWWNWSHRIYNTINDKDFYLTNSEYTKKDVLKHFPFIKDENIKTTLLAANNKFKPTKEKILEGNYIFSLCTLGKRKNLIFAIENFFKFIEKHDIKDLKLVLGGGVWKRYENELNNILNKYDKSKIILTGYIDEKELNKYYSNAICFIYPSLYEGFGLPVLEAMQCGCPVISSNSTSLPEVIGECGIQIDPTNNDDMIHAYEKMYFDKDFRKDCIKKGIERARLFSWEKCAKEILDFINSKI